jgi:Ca-activated chloride channel family protein
MRRRNKILSSKIALLVMALTAAAACVMLAQQSPQGQKPQDDVVFTSDTNLVVFHVSVVDKSGKLVTDIPQSAFKVFEDGTEQQIKMFKREDVPVSMGLIIDNSGSMRDKRPRVAAASLAMIKASNPQDEEFIVNFNDEPYLDQPLTSDTKKLEHALDQLDSRGGTAMRDAISLSIDEVKAHGKREKKVLVVITDGNDNASAITLEQLVRKAQQSEVLIYAIGLLSEEEPRDARAAKKALKLLTENSGGLDYYPKDVAEIDKVTPVIAHELRNQFVLAYSSTNQAMDGTYRKVKITVNAKGTPAVRTRPGYFAGTTKGSGSGSHQ